MSVHLYLTWPGTYLDGFKRLQLDLMNGKARVDRVPALSGFANCQMENFIHPSLDESGSGRPISEGVYRIGIPEYNPHSWGDGLGYWWSDLVVQPEFRVNTRSAFGIHDDFNRSYAKGSAGCVVTYSTNDFQRILKWLQFRSRPTTLVVDWKLGFLGQKGYPIVA
jgi:hypothetical protein